MENATREMLAARGRPVVEPVEGAVPGWENYRFHLRRFGGVERDWWDLWVLRNAWNEEDARQGRGTLGHFKPGVRFRAMLVGLALCDESGALWYDVQDGDDLAELAALDGDLLDWLYGEIRERNGLGPRAEERAAKNSDSGGSGATGSGSPPCSDARSPRPSSG